jgi:hypothetical protein
MFSRSIFDNSRRIFDNSKIIFDNSRSIIDDHPLTTLEVSFIIVILL